MTMIRWTAWFAFSGKSKQAFHRKHFFFSGILHSILAIKPLIDSYRQDYMVDKIFRMR